MCQFSHGLFSLFRLRSCWVRSVRGFRGRVRVWPPVLVVISHMVRVCTFPHVYWVRDGVCSGYLGRYSGATNDVVATVVLGGPFT